MDAEPGAIHHPDNLVLRPGLDQDASRCPVDFSLAIDLDRYTPRCQDRYVIVLVNVLGEDFIFMKSRLFGVHSSAKVMRDAGREINLHAGDCREQALPCNA